MIDVDYLYMGIDTEDRYQYILVLKDDFSGLVRLIPTLDALVKKNKDSFKEAREALDAMHRVYGAKNSKKRDQKRG